MSAKLTTNLLGRSVRFTDAVRDMPIVNLEGGAS